MSSDSGSDEDSSAPDQYIKVVILGDGASGKTSIATRYAQSDFGKDYKQTLGVDFFLKRAVISQNTSVCLQVWDIGGQTLGGDMLKNYLSGAKAVLLVYDITNSESFTDLEDWLQVVKQTCHEEMPALALVGNKVDLEHMRVVKREAHQKFAADNNMSSHFVSARTDDMTVVKAEVINYGEVPKPAPSTNPKSSFCSLQ